MNINTSSSDDGGAACRIIDIKTGNLVTVYKNIDGSVIGWNRQKDDGGENIMKFNKKKSQHTQAAHIAQKTGLTYKDAGLICEIANGIQKNNQDEDGGEEL